MKWHWLLPVIGILSLIVYLSILPLGSLRGPATTDFLWRYFLAFGLYALAIVPALWHPRFDLRVIWLFAIAFRVTLLFSPPTLSDDVYRYIWDGHVQNNGVNPYAYRVGAPQLDSLSTPNRARVNNAWMASPYLPVAQLYFAVTYRLAPESAAAFQIGAVALDLATGLFVVPALRRVNLPKTNAIIYLWNPLVIVEAAHGAHVDTLMTMLMMASLWLFTWVCPRRGEASQRLSENSPPRHPGTKKSVMTLSAVLLALATLVKPVPVLLVPVVMWRWGWKRTLLYAGIAAAGILAYSGAGLGLGSELAGTGVFGATRIYLSQWNFNGGLFHWLELALTGVSTPGAAPIELAGTGGALARSIAAAALVAVLAGIGLWARRIYDARAVLQIALLPLGAYVLLATTINPWYLMPVIALLPFQADFGEAGALSRAEGGAQRTIVPGAKRSGSRRTLHIAAWIYFSAAVALSYLTYVDPNPLKWGESYEVRALEYLPLYALLAASALALWRTRRAAATA